MWNDKWSAEGLSLFGRASFDPGTLAVGSMGATAVGTGISVIGTLAGGDTARQAGVMQRQEAEFQAQQLESNATQAIAAGQRRILDTQQKTRLAMSSATAAAGASDVAADEVLRPRPRPVSRSAASITRSWICSTAKARPRGYACRLQACAIPGTFPSGRARPSAMPRGLPPTARSRVAPAAFYKLYGARSFPSGSPSVGDLTRLGSLY
jgi:hypothetical protein